MIDSINSFVDNVKEIAVKGKDISLSFVIEQALKYVMKKYGDIEDFSLNSIEKKIVLNIRLKGERELSTVEIRGYSFVFGEKECGFKIDSLESNKEWFNAIAKDFIANQTFPITNKYVCDGLKKFL